MKITTDLQARKLSYPALCKKLGAKPRFDFPIANRPALVLRVSKLKKVFVTTLRDKAGKRHTISLGDPSLVTIKAAFDALTAERGKLRGDIATDHNMTVAALYELYMPVHIQGRKKGRALKAPERFIDNMALHVLPRIGEIKIADLARRDISRMVDSILEGATHPGKKSTGGNTPARSALQYTNAMLAWAVRQEYLQVNPASSIELSDTLVQPSKPRDRHLSVEEISIFTSAVNKSNIDPRSKIAIKLLLLLGNRCGEYYKAQWADIDLEKGLWKIPAENNKTDTAYTIPLPKQAINLLTQLKAHIVALAGDADQSLMLGGISNRVIGRALKRLQQPTKKSPAVLALSSELCPHDLRRSCASFMGGLGIREEIIRSVLAHSSGGVFAIYDRSDKLEQRLEAHQKLADFIDESAD